MIKASDNNLRKVNHFLTALVVILALYIMMAPFLPGIEWNLDSSHRKIDTKVVKVTGQTPPSTHTIPDGYWLDIPRLNLHEQIYTGLSIAELNKGVWHIPGTSTPDKGSNTVVAGHRFTYTNPRGVFYFLDKVQLDDRVTVDWAGKEYTYKVTSIDEVPPTDLAVNAPTKANTFTFYTCTPLLTAKNRLVITSEFVAVRTS